jgi:spermidine synthase
MGRATKLDEGGAEDTPGSQSRGAKLRPMVVIEAGRKVLRVGGVIQSVHVDAAYEPDVWDAMLPHDKPASALILGLGGGTMAQLLTARHGPLPITGVERDPAVIWLARREFGLDALPHVRIVREDAFAFVRRMAASASKASAGERYDAICVDLYTAGKMAHGVFDPSFLRDLARILAPAGLVTFNLWRSPFIADQLRRLARVFTIQDCAEVDDNLVVRYAHAQ